MTEEAMRCGKCGRSGVVQNAEAEGKGEARSVGERGEGSTCMNLMRAVALRDTH